MRRCPAPAWPREAAWWAEVLRELSALEANRDEHFQSAAARTCRLFAPLDLACQQRLASNLAAGGRLELWPAGLSRPRPPAAASCRPFDVPRLAWWPTGWCDEPLVGIASSRLPRALDTLPEYFRALRAAVRDVASRHERLTVVVGMAASPFATRAAVKSDLPLLQVTVAPARTSLEDWLSEFPLAGALSQGQAAGIPPNSKTLYLSPPLDDSQRPPPLANLAVPDRVLAALADRIDVLYLQQGGTWHSLLRWFARATQEARPVVRIASHPKLVRHKLFRELVSPNAGAPFVALEVGELKTSASRLLESQLVGVTSPPHAPSADIRSLKSLDGSTDDYLIHFTRRRDGPWPDQPWDDYYDELLDERPERDRSPLAVLRRILLHRRILSSRQAIRGSYPVVCFADVRLASLAGRRVWRRHRRRWDFEPFGLAIRREALQARGARPVIYGDDATWQTLAEVDRPYFQKSLETGPDESTVRNRAPGLDLPAATIDWRAEREWRVVGSVELAAFSIDDLLVFVPNRQVARVIAAGSRVPIVVLQES